MKDVTSHVLHRQLHYEVLCFVAFVVLLHDCASLQCAFTHYLSFLHDAASALVQCAWSAFEHECDGESAASTGSENASANTLARTRAGNLRICSSEYSLRHESETENAYQMRS